MAPSWDDQRLLPEARVLLRQLASLRIQSGGSLNAAEVRARYRSASQAMQMPGPSDIASRDLYLPGHTTSLRMRLYAPAVTSPSPAIVYAHGGGWNFGDLDTHDPLCRKLARGAGARVISIDYRLAPEDPFPAAVEDVCHALRHVFADSVALGIDSSRIAVAGDSAGANLMIVGALRAAAMGFRVCSQVLFYPDTDLRCHQHSYVEFEHGYILERPMIEWAMGNYLRGTSRTHRDVSPAFADNLADSPPTLLLVAECDPLRDECLEYSVKLAAAGVDVQMRLVRGLLHGFATMDAVLPAAATEIAHAIHYLTRKFALSEQPRREPAAGERMTSVTATEARG
jgi:acetyl esterase